MNQLPTRLIKVTATTGSTSVQVENVFIEFEYIKQLSSKPGEGVLRIYNLKPSTSRFFKSAENILIEAGYTNNNGVVFDGDVRKSVNKRKHTKSKQGVNHVTEIFLGGNVATITSVYTRRSYKGVVSLKQIITDAVNQFGLPIQNLSILPDTSIEDFTWSGRTKDLLDEVLKSTEYSWFEDSGTIIFHKATQTVTLQRVLVNESTGMISTPTIEDSKIKFKTLLNPALKPGGLVRLESVENDEANGEWKIKKITFKGSNRDGSHTAEVEGVKYVSE